MAVMHRDQAVHRRRAHAAEATLLAGGGGGRLPECCRTAGRSALTVPSAAFLRAPVRACGYADRYVVQALLGGNQHCTIAEMEQATTAASRVPCVCK